MIVTIPATIATITSMTTPMIISLVITKSNLKTCPPYTIKYPKPAFDTKNSPDITPTKESPIFTFNEFMNVPIFAGITIFVSNCNLVQLKVLAILIISLSVFRYPFNISNIVTISEIAIAITIIAGFPEPTQMIIIGPNATFGKLFNTTKYGSATFAKNLDHQRIIAIPTPKIVPSPNPIIVS